MVTGSAEAYSNPRRGVAEMIEERETDGFFDADAAGANAAIGERGERELCGAFVFLPGVDVHRNAEALAEATLFECGDDHDGIAFTRYDEAEEAFAESPMDASEVVKGGAGSEEEGVEALRGSWCSIRAGKLDRRGVGHEPLGVLDAFAEFGWCDRDARAHRAALVSRTPEGGLRERLFGPAPHRLEMRRR